MSGWQPLNGPGPSPLTRGKRLRTRSRGRAGRLIPAHAGKTSSFSWLLRRSAAHPRSRGENYYSSVHAFVDDGSSPLTRGKRYRRARRRPNLRLIPAHAGKTPSKPRAISQPGAHPRSRGENLLLVLPSGSIQGSSPLTRGKPCSPPIQTLITGLIPAHAGKTEKKIETGLGGAAHPRSRGENAVFLMPEV